MSSPGSPDAEGLARELEQERAEIRRQRLLSAERRAAANQQKQLAEEAARPDPALKVLKRKIKLVQALGVVRKMADEIHEFHEEHSEKPALSRQRSADEPLEEVARAVLAPPSDTRAFFRGECLRRFPAQIAAASS